QKSNWIGMRTTLFLIQRLVSSCLRGKSLSFSSSSFVRLGVSSPCSQRLGGYLFSSLPNRSIISKAAAAHSLPLLPWLPPERWIACSSVSQVRIPNKTGIPQCTPEFASDKLTARLIC